MLMEKNKKPKKPDNPNAKHRERMRARYIKAGLDAMAPHEILEMLLFYAIPRKDTNKMAHRILNEFGSLHNIFESSPQDIVKRCKLTKNTAVLLSMIAPLARQYNLSKWNGRTVFTSSKELGEYAVSLFIGEVTECFYIICLNNSLSLVAAELLEKGTIDRIELYPKEILRRVLYHNASYVVLAHNHPSGSTDISSSDITTTNHIKKLMLGVEIDVLDHIIVCGPDYISLAEKRLLKLAGIEGALANEQ